MADTPDGLLARAREAQERWDEALAEIARLTAELDAVRAVPAEYVITAGLEAAMAADPHREDGSVLRVTDGERQAYVWKAATGTWESITVPGDTSAT